MGNIARGESGYLFFTMKYTKPVYSTEKHIELLKNRGLTFLDEDRAKRYLSTIGYYRLSAYFLPFQAVKDRFRPKTTFNNILELYIFDRKLRVQVMDALERIEVAIRTVLSDTVSSKYNDPHWYLKKELFCDSFVNASSPDQKSEYEKFVNKIIFHTGKKNWNHGNNSSCRHYYTKYKKPELPPSWMVVEVLPMGTWSVLYSNIKVNKVKQQVSKFFKFSVNDFAGWVHALTLIRNCCAHHNRLWNHNFPPKAKNIEKYTHEGIPLNTPYVNLALIQAFLSSFTRTPTWSERLYELLQSSPLDIHSTMHFPPNWHNLPFWGINSCKTT
ncbi:Abortive infection bacteriophage resistance protein [Candidatus Electrothrix aarhusensis]|jgi:abortive infection bacteriophage resistance protein|uniref:Abortive infection bacteriophage resistance protein n=1 Tax=Candidatus Electrothrix aarhusensis TaxID=1859131 RepID=A0A3S3U6T2_9BACT|nr:Abortive infection bacteriophage resistance protein [Candidatus Electrothrix aarhusensis]